MDGLAVDTGGEFHVCAVASQGIGGECGKLGVELLLELVEQPVRQRGRGEERERIGGGEGGVMTQRVGFGCGSWYSEGVCWVWERAGHERSFQGCDFARQMDHGSYRILHLPHSEAFLL